MMGACDPMLCPIHAWLQACRADGEMTLLKLHSTIAIEAKSPCSINSVSRTIPFPTCFNTMHIPLPFRIPRHPAPPRTTPGGRGILILVLLNGRHGHGDGDGDGALLGMHGGYMCYGYGHGYGRLSACIYMCINIYTRLADRRFGSYWAVRFTSGCRSLTQAHGR